MFTRHKFLRVVFIVIILAMVFSGFQAPVVTAQGEDGIQRSTNAQSGRLSILVPESGRVLPASRALGTFLRPADPALALAKRFAPEFGLKDPERELSEIRSSHPNDGRVTVRYQQIYQGIPVIGGELIVNTNKDGDLYSINGEVSPDLSLPIQPTIDSTQAAETALQALAKWYQVSSTEFVASEPELWIFDESLFQSSTRPVELVWRMELTARDTGMPVRELVLVNAQRGSISLHFNQVDTIWHSAVVTTGNGQVSSPNKGEYALLGSPLVNTYTANLTSSLPGTFLCNQAKQPCTNNTNPHADAAHGYAIGTYHHYATKHLRDSIDNNGMLIRSTVQYCSLNPPFPCPYANAFWNGVQMVYGSAYGFPLADDVVAHELTHGVTQYESNLFYYYQSGAINESFSDLWGEYYDQTNTQGNDAPNVKWLMGEDVSGSGAIRSMNNPPAYSDPDKMSSVYYYKGSGDNGGVHTNSGVNNKAVFLMVDGGTFNGKTVTALGWEKTGAIYYEAQTNLLTSGSDYSDLYYALQQACSNLIGQKGITGANCVEVKDALDAVEMNGQPAPNFNTDAPLCTAAGTAPNIIFADDLESGVSNWTFNNGLYTRWQYDSPWGGYAQSGSHFLYADDYPAAITDASARLASFVVPNNAFMHFAHAYDFEYSGLTYYDGGVLEYSLNNGSTWVDAGSLIDFNSYTGTIYANRNNPLSSRSAFVGSSHGYISTRLNLASLAGQTVTFRWRMGLDAIEFAWGWWLDNIKVYSCEPAAVFADVPNTYWAWQYIERLYEAGITGGCDSDPLRYCPESTVTRAQMAVFLLRGIHASSYGPPSVGGETGFADVPTNYWAAAWIKQLAVEGITGGCRSGDYCPESFVTRAQMAVFLLRGKYGSTYSPPIAGAGSGFEDVPANYWAAAWIKQLAAEGITGGCGDGNYCPEDSVTRAQMAVFLVRTFHLP